MVVIDKLANGVHTEIQQRLPPHDRAPLAATLSFHNTPPSSSLTARASQSLNPRLLIPQRQLAVESSICRAPPHIQLFMISSRALNQAQFPSCPFPPQSPNVHAQASSSVWDAFPFPRTAGFRQTLASRSNLCEAPVTRFFPLHVQAHIESSGFVQREISSTFINYQGTKSTRRSLRLPSTKPHAPPPLAPAQPAHPNI